MAAGVQGGERDHASSEQTEEIQRRLRHRGFDLEVDGLWGPVTQRAFTRYTEDLSRTLNDEEPNRVARTTEPEASEPDSSALVRRAMRPEPSTATPRGPTPVSPALGSGPESNEAALRVSKLGAYAPEPAGLDAIGQFGESLLYAPVGAYEAGKAVGLDVRDAARDRDLSFGRSREMGKQMGKAIAEDFRHPIRNAGYLTADLLGAAGGAAGTAGRLGSAGRAARQAGRHAPGMRLPGVRTAADATPEQYAQAVGDALHERLKAGKPVDPRLLDHYAEVAKLHVGGTTSRARAAARGFTRPKSRGFEQLLHYDRGVFGGKVTTEEITRMEGEIRQALDLDQAKVSRRERYRKERQDAKDAFKAKSGVEKGFALVGEASDALRAAILYLRPAYLPNNWAGNELLNLIHQGFLAPVNLAKSMVITRKLGPKRSRAVDAAMGSSATEAALGAEGLVKAAVSPGIHAMSKAADMPFRRAAFLHEARRAGYRTLSQVRSLIDAAERSPARMRELGEIALKANEEVVKFGKLTPVEQTYLRPFVFIYSWTRAATRYAARFPVTHPIQLAAQVQLGRQGREYVAEALGDTPNWLRGYIPVGIDADANPVLINPTNMTPLGTGLDSAMALIDSVKLALGQEADTKGIFEQVNPLLGLGLGATYEYTPVMEGLERVPLASLYQGLKHPGEGSKTFPGTRQEAVGRFVAGSAYPRVADAEEIHKQALAKYPAPVRHYYKSLQLAEEAEKATGIKLRPQDRVELGWQRDLETALDDAEIATGDYGHRLRILVEEYIKRNPKAADMRQWAQTLSAPEYQKEAQSQYLKLRKAFTPSWNSYYEQVVKRYEDMIAG